MIGNFLNGVFWMIWRVVTDQPGAKADLLPVFPDRLQPVISALLTVSPILGTFATLFALTTLVERKGLGRIQNRLGPNRVCPLRPLSTRR